MQEFPKFIWSLKYQLKDSKDQPFEFSMDESKDRVAKALAVNEKNKKKWELKFRETLEHAIPAGRIMSNAGAEEHKTAVSLINCLTGDTPVLTEDGIFTIDDLMGSSTYVLNGKGNWVSVDFQQYGEQEVVELQFKLNHDIRVKATLGHRWILTNGQTVTTQYLIENPDATVPCVLPTPELNPDYDEGLVAGLLFDHDLFQVARTLPERVFVQSMTENYSLDVNWSKLLSHCYQVVPNYQEQNQSQEERTEFRPNFSPSFPSYYRSSSYLLGFIAGLFAVNGTVTQGSSPSPSFTLSSDFLTPFQIKYLKGELIQAGILVESVEHDQEQDQLVFDPRSLSLPFFLNTNHRKVWTDFKARSEFEPLQWTYLGHRPLGIEPVYCCQELETQSFVLGSGILTGNCVVSDTVDDSMESISAKLMEAASTLKFGCGTGYEFSTLRPEGSFVRGSGSTTSGPLSFMDVYDLMCKTITSAGGRRGAQMATFLDSHPDIFKFIQAKRQDGRLRNFNLSVLATNDFINAVRGNGPWELRWKDEISQIIQAEHLWNTIMKSAYNWAEPGFLLVDRINQFNNLWFEEYLAATNPSMPAGTLVHTDRGILPIEELEGSSPTTEMFKVKNIHDQWVEARCFFSGRDKPLIEITFDGKRKIKSTPEHKWPVVDPVSQEIHRVLASDLKVGDLIPLNTPKPLGLTGHPELTNDDGFLLGFLLNYGLNQNSIVEILYDSEASRRALAILNSYRQELQVDQQLARPEHVYPEVLDTLKYKFGIQLRANPDNDLDLNFSEIPQLVFTSNDQFITGVLDGIISTGFSEVKKGIVYRSRDRKKFKQVAKLLGFLGIKCSLKMKPKKLWRSKYTLTIKSKYALSVLLSQIDITNRSLVSHIQHLLAVAPATKAEDKFNRIVKIKPANPEDVWDISVYDDQHMFPIAWGFTGNCGEQALPPYGACLLGSLMLHRFVKDPFSPNARFDMPKYRESIITFTRMLDNVVELANLPLPEQMRSIKWTRRHGMGYMGLGSALIMLGMRYGSPEALAFVDSVTKELAMTGMEAGIELAKEKGCAPILEVNYSDFDKINYQAERCFNFNWKGKPRRKSKVRGIDLFLQSHYFDNFREDPRGQLILRDIDKYGCRFSHHSSIAPTGCCHGATRIQTKDGIKSYWEILEENDIDWQAIEKTNVKRWFPIKPFDVLSLDGQIDSSDKIWYNGHEETLMVKFEDGTNFICTRNHKLLVLNEKTNEYLWVEADFLSNELVCAYREASCNLRIIDVSDYQEVPTWDIEAQSTHCYLLENGVVSHNTIASSFGENCCLAKGTIVDTDHGFLPIEDVTTDMKVMNFDVGTNRFEYAPITFAGLTRPMTTVYELELEDGKKVRATADHKFLVLINEELRYESLEYILDNGCELYEVVVVD